MHTAPSGREPARILTDIPGPQSRALAARLARVESRNITAIGPDGPVFWESAAGANVRDVDGNVFVDLTAGFGVANAGHANAAVAVAIAEQAGSLPHAMGDVHPAEVKVRLLETLARLAPGDLSVTILGSAGAEAVEAALKTAVMHTGRPGVIAFERAYHGLTYGALATTSRQDFRQPFQSQLPDTVRFAPFPGKSGDEQANAAAEAASIAAVKSAIDEAESRGMPVGAILVEPIQGRGGIVVPTDRFLERLRELCDGRERVLIFDEIYTGFGRTGHWFAAQHWGVVPDILCAGKAMSGSVALSAAIGTPDVMGSWPASRGEAIHTSTFLGNPIACAAALAQIAEIEAHGLVERAALVGGAIRERTSRWVGEYSTVLAVRGLGLLQGVVMGTGQPVRVSAAVQRKGVLVLPEGNEGEVLAITPPAVIAEDQLAFALDAIEGVLEP